MIKVDKLNPFGRMCISLGMLPSSYKESLTYEEQLLWFFKYLDETVIPTVNNNGDAVEELQALYLQIKNYVDNYFDNLDVQEEINNKLDDMADSGELTDIIAQYLQLAGVLAFNTLSDLEDAENIVNGSICLTLGKNNYNDGKSAYYKIREILNTDVVDGDNIIAITHDEDLVGEKIKNDISEYLHNEYKINFLSGSVDENYYVGDCIVLTGTKNVIIDLGYQGDCESLINFLDDHNIKKIDYVFITHYHGDHIAKNTGLSNLLSQNIDFSECQFILPHSALNISSMIGDYSWLTTAINTFKTTLENNDISYRNGVEKEIIKLDDNNYIQLFNLDDSNYTNYYSETINWNLGDTESTIYNNFSMVIKFVSNNNYIWFNSDIEYTAQEALYDIFNRCDLLKVEHHSLNYNTSQKYLNQLNPKITVITPLDKDKDLEDLSHLTVYNSKSKGSAIYDTFTHDITVTSSLNSLTSENIESTIFNVNNDIYEGIVIPSSSDLNDITTPGIYYSPQASWSATLSNCPNTGSGFKLIVEKLTHFGGIIKQTLIQANNLIGNIYTRCIYEGSLGEWNCIKPSPSYRITSAEMVKKYNFTFNTPDRQNNFSMSNGVWTMSLDITFNEATTAYSPILELPSTVTVGNQSVSVNIANTVPIIMTTYSGTAYPCYISYATNKVTLYTRNIIPSGTQISGIVTVCNW